jgi:hypothetical protein
MFAFPGRIEDAVVRLVGILPASLLVGFGYCNMLTFTTRVEDIENAVIRFISVFGGFRMLSSAS